MCEKVYQISSQREKQSSANIFFYICTYSKIKNAEKENMKEITSKTQTK